MNTNKKGVISLTGFVVSLLLIAMFTTVFVVFSTQIGVQYGVTGENSLAKYNKTTAIMVNLAQVQNATNIGSSTNFIDIIGAFFSSGYAAMKTALNSLGIFEEMVTDSTGDMLFMKGAYNFGGYLAALILALLILGVIIAILVKKDI